ATSIAARIVFICFSILLCKPTHRKKQTQCGRRYRLPDKMPARPYAKIRIHLRRGQHHVILAKATSSNGMVDNNSRAGTADNRDGNSAVRSTSSGGRNHSGRKPGGTHTRPLAQASHWRLRH